MTNKTFKEVVDRSVEVINAFKKVEKRQWGPESAVIELMKQVGNLSKLTLTVEGYYMAGRDGVDRYEANVEQIGDELSDVLLMVIRLANHYGIDLEEVHLKEMDEAINHPLMNIKPS